MKHLRNLNRWTQIRCVRSSWSWSWQSRLLLRIAVREYRIRRRNSSFALLGKGFAKYWHQIQAIRCWRHFHSVLKAFRSLWSSARRDYLQEAFERSNGTKAESSAQPGQILQSWGGPQSFRNVMTLRRSLSRRWTNKKSIQRNWSRSLTMSLKKSCLTRMREVIISYPKAVGIGFTKYCFIRSN